MKSRLKSYPILSQVIKNQKLHTSIYGIGNVTQILKVEYPFEISLKKPLDSLLGQSFRINITDEGFEIIDVYEKDKKYVFKGSSSLNYRHKLPFEVFNFDKERFIKSDFEGYEIRFSPISSIIKSLKKSIEISQVGKESDIIEISLNSSNSKYSETAVNELINVFNLDGVKDRQLITKEPLIL